MACNWLTMRSLSKFGKRRVEPSNRRTIEPKFLNGFKNMKAAYRQQLILLSLLSSFIYIYYLPFIWKTLHILLCCKVNDGTQLLMVCVEHTGSMEPVCFICPVNILCFILPTIQTYLTDKKRLIDCHITDKYLQKLVRPKEFNFFVN